MSRARNLAGFGSAITSAENAVNIRVGFITASSYFGDGSELTGTPGGLGTALAENLSSPLNKIYYTNANLSIASTITVDPPESASAAYTQYTDIVMQGDADLIVGDGDTFIPDILGIGTFVDAPGVLSGGNSKVRADNYTNKKGTGAAYVPYGLAVPVGAAVSVGYGTAGTPGIVGVDTSDGIFFEQAGVVNIAVQGGPGLVVSRSVGSSNTRVGIGTTDSGQELTVYSASFCGLNLKSGRFSGTQNIGAIGFATAGGESVSQIRAKVDGVLSFRNRNSSGTLTDRLVVESDGMVQVATGSSLQLGNSNPTENTVYNYELIANGTIRKYYVSDTLNSGQLTRFTFTGTDRTSAMITINATGSWTSSDTANNHVAAQFMCRVFTNSSGTSSDNSTVTTPFAYTYSTGSYAFNNSGGNGYSIDITNPTGDSGVSFFYEVIVQNAVPTSQHVLTASSTA